MPSSQEVSPVLARDILLGSCCQFSRGVHEAKVATVRDWPVPHSVGEVQSFLGLASYYWRLVKDFANIISSLHRLTQKSHVFQWGEYCAAFALFQSALTPSNVHRGHVPVWILTRYCPRRGSMVSRLSPNTAAPSVDQRGTTVSTAESCWPSS